MTLDKSVYKLGDTIKVHVEASVKGGSSDVDKITGIYVLHSYISQSYTFSGGRNFVSFPDKA